LLNNIIFKAHRFAIEPLTFLSTARMLALERESSFLLFFQDRLASNG